MKKGSSLILLVVTLAVIGLLFVFLTINSSDRREAELSSVNRKTDNRASVSNLSNSKKIMQDSNRMQRISNLMYAIKLSVSEGEIVLKNTDGCKNCTSNTGTRNIDGSGWVKFIVPQGKQGLKKYYPNDQIPVDPINEGDYIFSYHSNGVGFELNTKLIYEKYDERMINDGGNDKAMYEEGTDLFIN